MRLLAGPAAIACLLLVGCAGRMDAGEGALVEARLQHYSSLVVAMDPEAIAAMFSPDAELDNPGQAPVRGREEIRRLFSSFKGYRVLENEDRASSTRVTGGAAVQEGTFHQRVQAPDGRIIEVSGRFAFDWVKMEPGGWMIRRIATLPDTR